MKNESGGSRESRAFEGAVNATESTTLDSRLDFLSLTRKDAARLRRYREYFERNRERFLESFYSHLLGHAATASFFHDPALLARLKESQWRHFASLLSAEWNDEYVERRRRVGDAHAQAGVSPQYFLGAYNRYTQFWLDLAMNDSANPAEESREFLSSLLKVVFLDIGLTIDVYFEESTANLRNALDMLWKANQELRQFAQLMTHDLKTPLATMANLCDETLDEFGSQMPDEARKLVDAAKQGAFRMSALIDEFLSSAMSADPTDAESEIDLTAAVAQAIERLRPAMKKKEVDVEVDHELPKIWGNAVRCREAIYNLLSNAVKYLDKRPGHIRIQGSRHNQLCRLSIGDNGPGIPADEIPRLFMPFRRLAMHRDLPGTGLGLYFTRTLVESLGGRISVESNLGAGTTFHLDFPPAAPRAGRR